MRTQAFAAELQQLKTRDQGRGTRDQQSTSALDPRSQILDPARSAFRVFRGKTKALLTEAKELRHREYRAIGFLQKITKVTKGCVRVFDCTPLSLFSPVQKSEGLYSVNSARASVLAVAKNVFLAGLCLFSASVALAETVESGPKTYPTGTSRIPLLAAADVWEEFALDTSTDDIESEVIARLADRYGYRWEQP